MKRMLRMHVSITSWSEEELRRIGREADRLLRELIQAKALRLVGREDR